MRYCFSMVLLSVLALGACSAGSTSGTVSDAGSTPVRSSRVRSTIPAIIVSGAIDAKTGARWGSYAASTLPNSTYVRIKGITHWVIAQSPCAQRIFQSFLSHPRATDTACATAGFGANIK